MFITRYLWIRRVSRTHPWSGTYPSSSQKRKTKNKTETLYLLNFLCVQWFRLIVPIFLHGGVIHILFNLMVQLRLGADMEKVIGTIRFIIIYFTAGIMGFILGANFAGNGIASTGCSGSLFGIIAVVV